MLLNNELVKVRNTRIISSTSCLWFTLYDMYLCIYVLKANEMNKIDDKKETLKALRHNLISLPVSHNEMK